MPWWLTYTLTKTVNNKQWLWYTQDHVLNTNTAVIKYELRGQFYVQTFDVQGNRTNSSLSPDIYFWSGRALKITLI